MSQCQITNATTIFNYWHITKSCFLFCYCVASYLSLPPPTPNICLLHSCIRSLQVAWLLGCCGFKMLKPARNKFTWHDFMNFSHNNFSRFTIFSVSGCCNSFTFKICQIVAGAHKYDDQSISRIYLSNYWRIFAIWFQCALWCLRVICSTLVYIVNSIVLVMSLCAIKCQFNLPSRFIPTRAGGQIMPTTLLPSLQIFGRCGVSDQYLARRIQ